LWLVPLLDQIMQRYKLSYKDPTHWLWSRAGIAAAFNALLQVFAIEFLLSMSV
jgi:hypothetical protein